TCKCISRHNIQHIRLLSFGDPVFAEGQCTVDCALEDDVNNCRKGIRRETLRRRYKVSGGVVNQDVHLTKTLFTSLQEFFYIFDEAYIAGYWQDRISGFLTDFCSRLCQHLKFAAGNHQIGPQFGKITAHGLSQSSAATGQDNSFARSGGFFKSSLYHTSVFSLCQIFNNGFQYRSRARTPPLCQHLLDGFFGIVMERLDKLCTEVTFGALPSISLILSERFDFLHGCVLDPCQGDQFIHQAYFSGFRWMEQLTFQQAAVGFGFTKPECIKLKYSIWNNYTDRDFVETNDIIAFRHDAVVATNGQHTPTGGAMSG